MLLWEAHSNSDAFWLMVTMQLIAMRFEAYLTQYESYVRYGRRIAPGYMLL